MEQVLEVLLAKNEKAGNKAMDIFGEITDDDIDSLFNDAF
jgi:hypothetical protein